MTVVDAELVDRMVKVIVDEVEPEQVYLFGSHARGDAREDSDVELLVVEREPFGEERSRFEETNRVYKALASFRAPLDVLLYSAEEMAKWGGSRYHIVGRCRREGRLLYART